MFLHGLIYIEVNEKMILDEKELKLSSSKLQQDRFYHSGLPHIRVSYPFATVPNQLLKYFVYNSFSHK
jgi:hypothetical protein